MFVKKFNFIKEKSVLLNQRTSKKFCARQTFFTIFEHIKTMTLLYTKKNFFPIKYFEIEENEIVIRN